MAIDFKYGDTIEVLQTPDTTKKQIAGCRGMITEVRAGVITALLTEPDGSTYVGATELLDGQYQLEDATAA
jgi:hypothetical protein